MCDILIPALLGVAALGLLSGGVGGGGSSTYTVIPQEVGDVTNGIPVASTSQPYDYNAGQFAYAAPQAQYAAPAYAPQHSHGYQAAPQHGYHAAPQQGHYSGQSVAPAYGSYNDGAGFGAGVNYDGQQAVGAGAYAGDGGVGIGANVGGMDAGVGIGARTY